MKHRETSFKEAHSYIQVNVMCRDVHPLLSLVIQGKQSNSDIFSLFIAKNQLLSYTGKHAEAELL